MNEKFTSLNSILLIVLKELRIERGIHQAVFADICGKQPSTWSKVESGKSPLSMDMFFKICYSNHINCSPSFILQVAERYINVLQKYSIAILFQNTENLDDDIVMRKSIEFYKNDNSTRYNCNILNSPYLRNGWNELPDVFNYIVSDIPSL